MKAHVCYQLDVNIFSQQCILWCWHISVTTINFEKIMSIHCPKYNLNLRIKTDPVTIEADATVYVCFIGQI